MSDESDKWGGLASPPPQMFLGTKERDLVGQINNELIETVIGQKLLYYAIDIENTNFHDIYGEAPVKTFLNPIMVHALVTWQGLETVFEDSLGVDKRTRIEVKFNKRRLTDDIDLFVREGDFINWGGTYYEIHKVSEPRELWGKATAKFEVVASCLKAREGTFDGS